MDAPKTILLLAITAVAASRSAPPVRGDEHTHLRAGSIQRLPPVQEEAAALSQFGSRLPSTITPNPGLAIQRYPLVRPVTYDTDVVEVTSNVDMLHDDSTTRFETVPSGVGEARPQVDATDSFMTDIFVAGNPSRCRRLNCCGQASCCQRTHCNCSCGNRSWKLFGNHFQPSWPCGSCSSLLEPYIDTVLIGFSEEANDATDPFAVEPAPDDDEPWWQKPVTTTQRKNAAPVFIDVQSLILSAVRHSHNLQAESNLPLIREDQIIEEDAAFDALAFMESKFSKISEPVGNSLTTGPERQRLRNSIWNYSAGLRKRTYKGGTLEFAQRFGYEDSNSDFFIPTQQGNARLTLRFDQPLLRGAGRMYNTSLIMLAKIDSRIAWAEFQMELQNYLLQVSNAYWDLYLQRASLLQKQRNLTRAAEILEELENRAEIDAALSQIVRARAALAARKSDLARAAAEVRNIEAQIRALVNDPTLAANNHVEFVPSEPPLDDYIPVSTSDALVTALRNRPEIDKALEQIRSGSLHVAVSEKELLPILDAVTQTYVSGLQGASDVGGAWVNQFTEGEPSYSVGLEFSVPLQNRASKARLHRKRLQLRMLLARYRGTVETLISEVEVAVRDVETLFKESHGKYHAMVAAQAELDALTERWRLLPGDDRAASLLLEDILGAQDRLQGQEYDYASARVAYAQSLMNLKRVTGTLLVSEQISIHRACESGLNQLRLDRQLTASPDEVLPTRPASSASPEPMADPLTVPVLAAPVSPEPFEAPLPE